MELDDELKEDAARLFVLDAREELGYMPTTLQDLIDNVADHNQLMIDSIQTVILDKTVRVSNIAMNEVFALAKALIEK